MNFSKNQSSSKKGSFVWKRNANTSNTHRRPATYNKDKGRLISQSSDYSNLQDSEPSISTNIKVNKKMKDNQTEDWSQLKSLAKRSTIASRMQLKKSIPISFVESSQMKYAKNSKTVSVQRNKLYSNIVDNHGNISKSFKQDKQFESLNPHIAKDMNMMKKKVYKMYEKQKKHMNIFLTLEQMDGKQLALKRNKNQRSKSLLTGSNKAQMIKITERQQYSSRMNSNRANIYKQTKQLNQYFEINQGKIDNVKNNKQLGNITEIVQNCQKANCKSQQSSQLNLFKKNSKSYHQVTIKSNKPQISSLSIGLTETNSLLKGLLGQYSNYQKLSKHQLIQKLISLEYLAQKIFKKNKFLEEELKNKQNCLKETQNSLFQTQDHISFESSKPNFKIQIQKNTQTANKLYKNKEIFIVNNDDGYFNEFLESQKGKQIEIVQIKQQQSQRFRENQMK